MNPVGVAAPVPGAGPVPPPEAGVDVATTGRRRALGLVGVATALALVVLAALTVGAKALSPAETLVALAGSGDRGAGYVIWELRGARTLAGLVSGVGLGVSGALIQAFTRNPLADPGILGVNAGAAFGVVLGVAVLGVGSVTGRIWLALLGAFGVTVAVHLIGGTGGRGDQVARLTLGGVALAAVLTGITTAIMLLDPATFSAMRSWNAGSLVGRDPAAVAAVLPFLATGLVLAAAVARSLDALDLGADLAAGLGARVRLTRAAAVVAITLLAGASTALAGPITFLGLAVPHLARRFTGPSQPWIIGYCAVLAPALLLASDVLARVVLAPGEVPVGVVTAFVGAPVLIGLARRRTVGGR